MGASPTDRPLVGPKGRKKGHGAPGSGPVREAADTIVIPHLLLDIFRPKDEKLGSRISRGPVISFQKKGRRGQAAPRPLPLLLGDGARRGFRLDPDRPWLLFLGDLALQ